MPMSLLMDAKCNKEEEDCTPLYNLISKIDLIWQSMIENSFFLQFNSNKILSCSLNTKTCSKDENWPLTGFIRQG